MEGNPLKELDELIDQIDTIKKNPPPYLKTSLHECIEKAHNIRKALVPILYPRDKDDDHSKDGIIRDGHK